jgi:AraC-like DNA-binding protein
MAIPSVLAEFGVDPAQLLAEFELDVAYFADPENTLAFATVDRMFGRCAELTACAHFGLLVGARAGTSSLGAVGYLMQSAPDVRSALGVLTQHMHLHDRGAMPTLELDNGHVALGYAIVDVNVEHGEQMIAGGVALGYNILRSLCGTQWRPEEVHFAFATPRDTGPYRAFFHVRPQFDRERSALIFPERWLATPLAGVDPWLHRFMLERVRELQGLSTDDLVERLRRLLKIMIMSPECSIETAAKQLGVSVRTLKRHLAAQGSSYRRLRDEVRFDSACQLLRRTSTPANQIASVLGYADAASFSRAFSRWAGTGPARWRADKGRRPIRKAASHG